MPMIKELPSVDMAAAAAQTAVKLGETPFFPGGNCIFSTSAPIGGAGVLTIEGSANGTTGWYTVRTLNAAQTARLMAEITDLPPWIRTRVSTVGTGTLQVALEGVQ